MDSSYQCTYTLSTKTFWKAYLEAGSRDHKLCICFIYCHLPLPAACMRVEKITAQFFPFICFCKQMQTVKKVCIDPWGTTWLPTLPKLGFAGCVLSCYQPNIDICLLSHCFYTRQQYEETETSNQDALTVDRV